MFPITNSTLIGTVRSAMLLVWTAIVTFLLDLAFVQNIDGLQDLINDFGTYVNGGLVIVLSGLIWAVITKLAAKKGTGGILGTLGLLASYAFVIPNQPEYLPPPSEAGVVGGSGLA
jgi:hypothetical protein